MARIRTIKPGFFKHGDLYDLEKQTGLPMRVAFAGIWTCCDREGRFAWKPRELKTDVLPHDNVDFADVLKGLRGGGFIQQYAVDGKVYGYIPSWSDHQVINNRESVSRLPAPDDASITRELRVDHAPVGEGRGREGNRKGRKQTLPASPADERKSVVREAIKKGYCWANKTQDCPWGPAEEVALNAMFIDVPKSFTAEMLVDCVRNRFLSEDVRSDPPRKWIRMILTWKEAPLDRFGKPKLQGNGNGNGKPNKATERFNSNVEAIAQGFGLGDSTGNDTVRSELAELQHSGGDGERVEGPVARDVRPIRVIDAT